MVLSVVDTLQCHNELIKVGFDSAQAGILVAQQKRLVENHFSTKQDLQQESEKLTHKLLETAAITRQDMRKMGCDIRQEMHEMGSEIRQEMQQMGNEIRQEMHEMGQALRKEIHQLALDFNQKLYAHSFVTIGVLGALMTLFHFV